MSDLENVVNIGIIVYSSSIVLVSIRAKKRSQKEFHVCVWTWNTWSTRRFMTLMRIVELVQAFCPCGGYAEKKQKKTMKGIESNSLKEGQFLLNYSWLMYDSSWLPHVLKRVGFERGLHVWSLCIVYEWKTTRFHHFGLLWLGCGFVKGQDLIKTCLEKFVRLWHQV